jgi:hypothetical protein
MPRVIAQQSTCPTESRSVQSFEHLFSCSESSQDMFNKQHVSTAILHVLHCTHIQNSRSRIHERTILLRFLGIILRVLRLEVSVYDVYVTNQFHTTFARGGGGRGVKSIRGWRQWWANLDQAPKDLDKTIFRDLSPTPKP